MRGEEPEGWPGVIHREGRTLMRVSERPDSERSGPVSRRSGGVFLNPAMSGSRTRSVLLLDYAMESGMLGDGAVYALDGLSAGGLRARRWLNELPVENARRLDVTISDLDSDALSWAMGSHLEFPPMHGGGSYQVRWVIFENWFFPMVGIGWILIPLDPLSHSLIRRFSP